MDRTLLAHAVIALTLFACAELRTAPLDPADGGNATAAGSEAGAADGDAGGANAWSTYEEAQKALESKRFAGPLSTRGSKGFCTANHFVWRDPGGALHSWVASTGTRVDHTFDNPENRPFFAPSDSYLLVDIAPAYAELAVYATGAAKSLVTTLPSAFAAAAGDDTVIRADQSVGGTTLGGTKVRRWSGATGETEDISQVLPTQQPPLAFANDELVIPGNVTVPYPLYIVNVAKKTTTSVVFDGAARAEQVLPTAEGLLVSYARSGGTSALRLYEGNQDAPSARRELGDELTNLPALYPDSPPNEHRLAASLATDGRALLYGSVYGIFAYDFATRSLSAVQLGANRAPLTVDVMCVIRDRRLLVYRDSKDERGQMWIVPLASVIP